MYAGQETPSIRPGTITPFERNMVVAPEMLTTVPTVGGLHAELVVHLSAGGVETLAALPIELQR